GVEAGGVEDLGEDTGKVDDRVPEHLAPLHPQFYDRAGGRRSAVDEEQVVVAPVGVEASDEDSALRFLGAEDERACPVTEEDAGPAVLPVEDPAERFRADDERGLRSARPKHRIGDRERIKESRADGMDVEGDA